MFYVDVTRQAAAYPVFTSNITEDMNVRIFSTSHMSKGEIYETFYFIVDAGSVMLQDPLPQDKNNKDAANSLEKCLTLFFENKYVLESESKQKLETLFPSKNIDWGWLNKNVNLFSLSTAWFTYNEEIFRLPSDVPTVKLGSKNLNDEKTYPFAVALLNGLTFTQAAQSVFFNFGAVSQNYEQFVIDIDKLPIEWVAAQYGLNSDRDLYDVEGGFSKRFKTFLRSGHKSGNI